MYEPWQIQLFGNLCVRQRERHITRFRSQHTGALLAYHRHQSHSRESLIEIFWPESEPETGRHNLSNALSSLRNQLEPPGVPGGSVIIADRFSVQLNPEAVTTDVA
jgi:DNA-binding SARP family transcriptional activator